MRKEIVLYFSHLTSSKVLIDDDFVNLFEHAVEKYGGLDRSLTLIVFAILDQYNHEDDQAYAFLEKLRGIH